MFKFSFDAIGTSWEIETNEPLVDSLRRAVLDRIEDFDSVYSRFRADSLVTRIATSEQGGHFEFPDEAAQLFDLYDRLHACTNGAIDPLVGRDLELLGYDRSYSLLPDPAAIARHALGRPSWSRDIARQGSIISTSRPLVIDVGGAGKGYLVDILTDLLRGAGLDDFLIDGGGDLRHSGISSSRIGLEDPADPGLAIGVIEFGNRALCASAINRRAWGDVHHVIDGRTGLPVRGVIATWVLADDAVIADGLATALFFCTSDELDATFQFSFVRIFDDGNADASTDLASILFT